VDSSAHDASLRKNSDTTTVENEPKPWPMEHETFVDTALVQQFLCLEIASGAAAKHKPEIIKRGKSQLLLPGSLRERGEFCILEVSLEEQKKKTNGAKGMSDGNKNDDKQSDDESLSRAAAKQRPSSTFAWKVTKVDFHKLNRFRERIRI
jgi:hypothetical protein